MADAADQATETAATASDGAAENPRVQIDRSRAQRESAERDSILAGLKAERESTKTETKTEEKVEAKKSPSEKKPAPEKKAAEKSDDIEEEIAAGADEETEDDDVDLDDLDDLDDEERVAAPDDDDDDEVAKDPQTAKRVAHVQRLEKRARAEIEKLQSNFARERDAFIAEWKPQVEEAQEYKKIKSERDIMVQLKHLGYSEDDFEDLSKIIYGHTKAAAADPKNRDAVRRLQESRALRERVAAAEARSKAIEERLAKQDSEAANARQIDAYVQRVHKAIGDETPLLKKSMEIDPKVTKKQLERLAYKMAMDAGNLDVSPRAVVKRFERLRRAGLERDAKLGDVIKAAPAKGDKTKAAAETKKSAIQVEDRTKSNGSAVRIPGRDEMLELLRSRPKDGSLDD